MKTSIENVFNFPGWASGLGKGSIQFIASRKFGIYGPFLLQQLRIKRVTVTVEKSDAWNSFNRVRNLRPDQYRNFILNNCDKYTELVINFSGFSSNRDYVSWNPYNRTEPIDISGITLKKITINQNGMPTNNGQACGQHSAFKINAQEVELN